MITSIVLSKKSVSALPKKSSKSALKRDLKKRRSSITIMRKSQIEKHSAGKNLSSQKESIKPRKIVFKDVSEKAGSNSKNDKSKKEKNNKEKNIYDKKNKVSSKNFYVNVVHNICGNELHLLKNSLIKPPKHEKSCPTSKNGEKNTFNKKRRISAFNIMSLNIKDYNNEKAESYMSKHFDKKRSIELGNILHKKFLDKRDKKIIKYCLTSKKVKLKNGKSRDKNKEQENNILNKIVSKEITDNTQKINYNDENQKNQKTEGKNNNENKIMNKLCGIKNFFCCLFNNDEQNNDIN